MANYFGNGIKVASGFDLGTAAPLDTRTVVKDIPARDALTSAYNGIIVHVADEGVNYQMVNGEWTTLASASGAKPTKVSKVIIEELTVEEESQTEFSLTAIPEGETLEEGVKPVLLVNGIEYDAVEGFNYDQELHKVTWLFTEVSGGFDLLPEFKVVFKYNVYKMVNA